jgi:acetyl-CoA synthetase
MAADFANYRKRNEAERTDFAKFAKADLITKLLDVLDGYDRALASVPDELKGEAIVVFAVLRPGYAGSAEQAGAVSDHIAEQLGKPLRPKVVRFVDQLPKTRNGKILRRLIRGAYLGSADLGDTSSLDDPRALDAIRAAVSAGG